MFLDLARFLVLNSRLCLRAAVATPKQIRELMKVDGLTNDEVKSHLQVMERNFFFLLGNSNYLITQCLTNISFVTLLQKYRLHTRRTSSDVGGVDQHVAAAAGGLWSSAPEQQYATSQHSTSQSQSGSPQGPLQLTVSSRAMSATAGDSCDEAEGGGRSESYDWEMQVQQPHGTKASSS